MQFSYQELYQMNPVKAREVLVNDYQRTDSISETARNFKTHRRIVRKWIKRHQKEGKKGLCNLSSSPKHPGNRLSSQIENLILKIRAASSLSLKKEQRRHPLTLLNTFLTIQPVIILLQKNPKPSTSKVTGELSMEVIKPEV